MWQLARAVKARCCEMCEWALATAARRGLCTAHAAPSTPCHWRNIRNIRHRAGRWARASLPLRASSAASTVSKQKLWSHHSLSLQIVLCIQAADRTVRDAVPRPFFCFPQALAKDGPQIEAKGERSHHHVGRHKPCHTDAACHVGDSPHRGCGASVGHFAGLGYTSPEVQEANTGVLRRLKTLRPPTLA